MNNPTPTPASNPNPNELYKFGKSKVEDIPKKILERIYPLIVEEIGAMSVSSDWEFLHETYETFADFQSNIVHSHMVTLEAHKDDHPDDHIFYDVCIKLNGEMLRLMHFHFWLVEDKVRLNYAFSPQENYMNFDF